MNLSEGCAPAERGRYRIRGGDKREGQYGFSFLFELLPFPCFLIWRRLPICDPFPKDYGRRIFSSVSFCNRFACQINVLLHRPAIHLVPRLRDFTICVAVV